MLCPTCEKHETSIVSEKYDKKTNSIKRNRYCICGNSFDTYEKIKKSEFFGLQWTMILTCTKNYGDRVKSEKEQSKRRILREL